MKISRLHAVVLMMTSEATAMVKRTRSRETPPTKPRKLRLGQENESDGFAR